MVRRILGRRCISYGPIEFSWLGCLRTADWDHKAQDGAFDALSYGLTHR